jgi:hypothetical protein
MLMRFEQTHQLLSGSAGCTTRAAGFISAQHGQQPTRLRVYRVRGQLAGFGVEMPRRSSPMSDNAACRSPRPAMRATSRLAPAAVNLHANQRTAHGV